MISEACVSTLKQIIPQDNILWEEPLRQHTSFRIGGPCDALVRPENEAQLAEVIAYLHRENIPCFLLGNGSNLLVSDKGFEGVIVQVAGNMSQVTVDGCKVIAQAGASMHKAAKVAYENGLTGLEFASGIPGTVGGGAVMNAGAYDGEFKDVVCQVEVLTPEGEKLILDNAGMQFGYRDSILKKLPYIVTSVTFECKPGDPAAILAKMEDFAERRRSKQPLEFPSAGSTFKRPEGAFAGKLIMDAGLRGFAVGGAQVSEKHCGFVINTGGATAVDVHQLIEHVQKCVKEQFSVDLEPEVLFLGE
ncbi:MAG: UDP-N-acetylmuramate dehydrogenase [Acetatifactor sp.]|nr:UDP-N-acetylmuramate dehydrogenase [Acetatifactor sp.]